MVKRILYLITRENVLDEGVLKSQVFELLGEIKKQDKDSQILLLNFPSLHKYWKSKSKLENIKKFTSSLNIELKIIPIIPIGKSTMPRWAIPFLIIQTIPWVIYFTFSKKINIFHARSYLSTLIFFVLKKFQIKKPILFDVRGLYLQEAETYNIWDKQNSNYKFWQSVEKDFFTNSDHVISQSSGMSNYIKDLAPSSTINLIPCNVTIEKFNLSPKNREQERKKLGISNKFVLVYVGSLGGYHDPIFLADFYSKIRLSFMKPHFLIITHSSANLLKNKLDKNGIDSSDYTIIHKPNSIEDFIQLGDIGIHVYNDIPVTSVVFSVKIGEYLAAGLPVIITNNLISIKEFVEINKCGVVIDIDNKEETIQKLNYLTRNYKIFKQRAFITAKNELSTNKIGYKYLKIYRSLF